MHPRKIDPGAFCTGHPLYDTAATRVIEGRLASTLSAHTLIRRAGASVAAMARAVAPHARRIWIACGPGNNGGDGLMAAALLAPWAKAAGVRVQVSWCGNERHLPSDALFALHAAKAAHVEFADEPPVHCDLAIDALLGLGANQQGREQKQPPAQGLTDPIDTWTKCLYERADTLLCVDIPTALNIENGMLNVADNSIKSSVKSIFTITFLTLKPGLFTAHGKDLAGEVWFDDLGLSDSDAPVFLPPPTAWLGLAATPQNPHRRENTHKGQFGDVWVLGGQGLYPSGVAMVGAAMLAARAALCSHAGRVFVVTLDDAALSWDPMQPELMLRNSRFLDDATPLPDGVWVCGCGGGEAVIAYLPKLLDQAVLLVLDADALNTVSTHQSVAAVLQGRLSKGKITVLTPHPLEAARLLGWTTSQVQANRLKAAGMIAQRYQSICVLKGSGTIIATPSGIISINPSGNSKLSIAGTGDVLAGMIGAELARQSTVEGSQLSSNGLMDLALSAVSEAVFAHGQIADNWPHPHTLTASQLVAALTDRLQPTTINPT